MLAALGNGVRGGKWFSLIDKVYRPSTLRSAWQDVLRNRGAAGVDRVSVERFAGQLERYLAELSTELEAGSYRPLAVRRVEIPKGDGKVRPLGIPTVRDRVVQAAVKRVIEPIFERLFAAESYGFRPGRGCKDALRRVDAGLKAGYTHVVDADLKGYFDSIPHARLKARLRETLSDSRLLALLDGWIDQDVVHDMKRWTPTSGTPQGAVISPLLANLYLHDLDETLAARGLLMVRYADDFVILCRSERRKAASAGGGARLGAVCGTGTASGQDPCGGLLCARTRLRVSGLPLRGRASAGCGTKPEGAQGQDPRQDPAYPRGAA
jgi:RNA-directed DNA polymerase